jgi:Leucine-rich repeat (LRR) protein
VEIDIAQVNCLVFCGNLCKLKNLDLSFSNLSRNIDGIFSNFSACMNNSLEFLDLSHNYLGEIPDSLGRLGSLRYLYLQFNSFWGSMPAFIDSLSSLQHLDLSYNYKMNGTIPDTFGQLSELVYLNLEETSWKGVITEAHLMNLTRLEDVTLTIEASQTLVFNVTYN